MKSSRNRECKDQVIK